MRDLNVGDVVWVCDTSYNMTFRVRVTGLPKEDDDPDCFDAVVVDDNSLSPEGPYSLDYAYPSSKEASEFMLTLYKEKVTRIAKVIKKWADELTDSFEIVKFWEGQIKENEDV